MLAFGVSAAQAAPPLPALALDTFPPDARAAVVAAHRDASSRGRDAAAAGALGRILHAWQQWESAHQAYQRAQALDPRSFEWPYLDAVVLQRLGRHDDAVIELTRALEVNRGYLPARVKLAESLLEAGALDRSRMLFTELIAAPEAEPAAQVGLGRIALAGGEFRQAAAHFERALSLFPELGAAHYGAARAYRALGRASDAEASLAAHARFGPRWPRLEDVETDKVAALRDDPRALLRRGTALADAGDLAGAIALHEDALKRDPQLAQAHANLIALYGRQRDWVRAEAHYRAATELGLQGADSHYDYGIVLGMQEKWDQAARAFEMALSLNPLHAAARNNLGQALEARGDYAAAAAQYRRAVEAQPVFRLARFNLGRMLLAQRDFPAATSEFERIQHPVDGETPRYTFALATALVQSGRKDEGVRQALAAKELAASFGQSELAAAIERELARLK